MQLTRWPRSTFSAPTQPHGRNSARLARSSRGNRLPSPIGRGVGVLAVHMADHTDYTNGRLDHKRPCSRDALK